MVLRELAFHTRRTVGRVVAIIAAALQLLGWIIFRPTAWHRLVQSIDPTLSQGFCLLYLPRDAIKKPNLRRLLLLGFCVLPLFAVTIEQLLRFLAAPEPPGTLQAFGTEYALNGAAKLVGMLRIGGILAVFVSVGAGIVAMIADIVVNEIIHQYFFYFMTKTSIHSTTESGYVQSYPGLCIALFSFCIGFSIYSQLHTESDGRKIRTKSLGAASLGVILSLLFAAIELIALRKLPIDSTTLLAICALVTFSSMVAISYSARGLPWKSGFWRCLWLLLTYSLLLFIGTSFAKLIISISPERVAVAVPLADAIDTATHSGLQAVITNCLLLLLIAPVVIAEWLGGTGAVAAAGGLIAPVCWLAITIFTDTQWNRHTWIVKAAIIVLALLCMLLGSIWSIWRGPLFFPFQSAWNRMLFQVDLRRSSKQSSWIQWNSAFWDEHQTLRSEALVEHLVLVITRWPSVGKEMIEQVEAGPQRWAAQAAQLELELRALECCRDMDGLKEVHQRLGVLSMYGPGMDELRSFSRLSQDISATMSQSNRYHRRIALRIVEEHMDRLARDWRLCGESLAARCLRILYTWRDLLVAHAAQIQREAESLSSVYIESPYIIGLPLSEYQHVFVGRTDVGTQIEKLIMSPEAPPLLLYGQRRMGKTSLLRNLGRLLPSSWVTVFVDLQALSSAQGHAGFLFQLARAIATQLTLRRRSLIEFPSIEEFRSEPFVVFDVWLDRAIERLHDQRAFLLLDEFEQLDAALRAGSLDPHLVLGMLRHVIQHKSRIRILIAGSHTFEEASTWSSYLINARIIKLGFLRESESRQLIERPIPDFTLRYHSDALHDVLALTGGHPYLLQLLCDRIIEMKNQQDEEQRFLATRQDVEAAVEPALFEASFFFAEMTTNQISPEGNAALKALAQRGRGAVQPLSKIAHLPIFDEPQLWSQLARRDLVELTPHGYRFQIELMRRYFAISTRGLAHRAT